MKRNLRILAYLLVFNFILVLLTMTYWQVIQRQELYTHPRNKRLSAWELSTERGRILDRNGKVLAASRAGDHGFTRGFPYGPVAAHIVGYNSATYGKFGLENSANAYLLGITGQENILPYLPQVQKKHVGYDVVTTIDVSLQQLAYQMLGERSGAAVVLNPKTGEILALVSRPAYDPNKIDQNWAALQQEGNGSPLLDRATQGLYPPGSTLKVVTGAGALQSKPENWNRIFDAPGYIVVNGNRIEDANAFGKINFTKAFQQSSNYVFVTLGLEMGAKYFYQMLNSFGLTEKIKLDLAASKPVIATPDHLNSVGLAETAIGQGRTLVTPLHMALVAATIANNGEMVQPFLIKEVKNRDGTGIFTAQSETGRKVIDSDVNSKLALAMKAVVDEGTGKRAALPGIDVAGKTGSAQNPHGQTHAWFIGYAPYNDPQVAVTVIVENGGSGGKIAAPIAGELMKAAITSDKR